MSKAGYRLFKRTVKNKKIYYMRIVDENGNVLKSLSTGETNQYAAHTFAKKEYDKHLVQKVKSDPTLNDFCADFFVWGKCKYVRRQNAKDRSIVRETADGRRHHLTDYILPKWGHLKLSEFPTPDKVEDWLLDLQSVRFKNDDGEGRELSNSTKNQIIYTLNIVLGEAARAGIIERAPEIEPFGTKRGKHRQPLTDTEIVKLFPESRQKFISVWDDYEIGVLMETILSTGARSGEARGWWKSDVLPEAKAIRIFRQMYRDDTYGMPGRQRIPDKDTRRIALIPERTLNDIRYMIGDPPYPDTPLFTWDGRPPEANYILKRLKRGVEKAGLEREIDVHTLRYTYTSKMRELMITADVPDSVLQKLLGHATPKVTDIYDPFMIERAIKKALPSRPAIDEFWNTEDIGERATI